MGNVPPRPEAVVPEQGSARAPGHPNPAVEDMPDADEVPMTAEEAELLEHLSQAFADIDAVPPALVEAAKQSFTWRTIDAEIAELTGDTADSPARVRAAGEGGRMLTFEIGSTAVVLEVSPQGRLRRLLGQIVQPRRAEVEVRHSGGSTSVTADEMGRFDVEGVPSGPLSLVCRFLDGVSRPVATSWVAV